MAWKFVLLYAMQLRLIGLLPITIGCQRNAPRHEPGLIAPIEERQLSNRVQSNIKRPTQSISNLYLKKRIDKALVFILKDIGCLDLLPAQFRDSKKLSILYPPSAVSYAKNDFRSFIEAYLLNRKKTTDIVVSYGLSNKLLIVFDNNQQHSSSYKHRLLEKQSIAFTSNPSNSETHSYDLIGFLVHISIDSDPSKQHFIPFVQSGKKWYYDNHDGRKIIDRQKAVELASESGSIFFYTKIT